MYHTLKECLLDLEKNGELLRVREELDPRLEIAAVHLRVHEMNGPALLFERVKGSKYPAVSNLFGTVSRSKFIFRKTWDEAAKLIAIRKDPMSLIKKPFQNISTGLAAWKALPLKTGFSGFREISLDDLPHVVHWPDDGGAFITLPQVYTENQEAPGVLKSNLGMYRIQLNGNDYASDEVGLHYQIHRGIGVHQAIANKIGQPLKVSIFIGGPPAHTLAAVMPLPEDVSELLFAGLLAGRRFRYHYKDGFLISNDADFVITGTVEPGLTRPEGPFGDHLGYYSLTHPFPAMKVHKVYAREAAVWPFTVVGRPPQEDTAFGALIHELTGSAIQDEIPGVQEVHAVDAAGVHPLLLAIGSERYTPYLPTHAPAEILTQANRVLGTGQLSLAKFLCIVAPEPGHTLTAKDPRAFFQYLLARTDWRRDLHFFTHTSIDTLDYSGTSLNRGSKVVIAACGPEKRKLATEVPGFMRSLQYFENPQLVLPGVVALSAAAFETYEKAKMEMDALSDMIIYESEGTLPDQLPLIVVCDDAAFLTDHFNNFLWVTFTRCNPARDIYGVDSFVHDKHWGCRGSLMIDARKKPHHAPVLEKDPEVEKKIDRLFQKGGSLYACRGKSND